MKLFVALLLGAVLSVVARAQSPTNNIPSQAAAAGMLEALLYGLENRPGLVQFITLMDRETDPSPLLDQRALLGQMQAEAPEAYIPAIHALIHACDTALDLYVHLQEETPAVRAAIPRYVEAVRELNGFAPINAVAAAQVRNLEAAALAAEQFYERADQLRATAIEYSLSGAAAKVRADRDFMNP